MLVGVSSCQGVIILITTFAFAFLVYMVYTNPDMGRETPPQFERYFEAFLSMYRVLMGDFGNRFVFGDFGSGDESPMHDFMDWWLQLCFLTFTVVGMILMLNILIAVVSDSYEYAVICSRPLFLDARISLVADLNANSFTSRDTKRCAPARFVSRNFSLVPTSSHH